MSQTDKTFSSVTKNTIDSCATQRPTYIHNASQEKRPTKEQAVVLTAADPSNIHDTPYYAFIRAVANIVGAQHIVAASKIPGSKFCIFLSTVDLAKKFQDENPIIKVNELDFTVSPYIQPAAKLVLCNTWPFIPNHVFEETLDKVLDRSIKFISPMKDMSMGFLDKEFSNIAFFKRFVFIQSMDSREMVIPDYIIVTYEGISYKVYLEIENKCKKCQGPHPANKCTVIPQDDGKRNLKLRLDQAKEKTTTSSLIIPLSNQNNTLETKTTELKDQNKNRAPIDFEKDDEHLMEAENHQSITPTTPTNENNKRVIEPSPTASQPQFKKTGPMEEEEEIFAIASDILTIRPEIMLDPQEIARLWMDLKGKQNKKEILNNFNGHDADLFQVFEGIHQHPSTAKSYKNRAKKIAALLYAGDSEASDSSSLKSTTE